MALLVVAIGAVALWPRAAEPEPAASPEVLRVAPPPIAEPDPQLIPPRPAPGAVRFFTPRYAEKDGVVFHESDVLQGAWVEPVGSQPMLFVSVASGYSPTDVATVIVGPVGHEERLVRWGDWGFHFVGASGESARILALPDWLPMRPQPGDPGSSAADVHQDAPVDGPAEQPLSGVGYLVKPHR